MRFTQADTRICPMIRFYYTVQWHRATGWKASKIPCFLSVLHTIMDRKRTWWSERKMTVLEKYSLADSHSCSRLCDAGNERSGTSAGGCKSHDLKRLISLSFGQQRDSSDTVSAETSPDGTCQSRCFKCDSPLNTSCRSSSDSSPSNSTDTS